jgi:superfamily II DNA or RNA helicase
MLADRLNKPSLVTRVTGKSYLALQEEPGGGEWRPGVYVVSLDLAKRDDIGASLAASSWDLVIVDEAHVLSGNRAELVVALAGGGRVRSLVLLSAAAEGRPPCRRR